MSLIRSDVNLTNLLSARWRSRLAFFLEVNDIIDNIAIVNIVNDHEMNEL